MMQTRNNKSGVWDPRIAPEENVTNWGDSPVLRPALKTSRSRKPTLVDLFSGPGGFSVGLEWAGFQALLGLDHHLPSANTYAKNHPHAATILGDIRKVSDQMILDALGGRKVDLVTAGVPCQGFSICNRKRHDDDKRNFLFHEFIRVVRLLQPKAVILENVSSLRSAGDGRFERDIAEAIAQSGYHVESRVLSAAEFGVPQLRRRIFFVGVRGEKKFAWPRPTHGSASRPFVTTWEAIGDLPRLQVGEWADQYRGAAKTAYQRKMRKGAETLLNHRAPRHPQATIDKIARTAPGKPMYARFKQRIRLHPDQPSPTQVSGGIRPQFSLGHPKQPRGLTIRERCRIQSFPDCYEITGGIVQGRVQTGNAVPPLLAEVIGKALIKLV